MTPASWSGATAADGSVVVDVRGELDNACSGRLRIDLCDRVSRHRPVRLVVDLLHVTFIDSTGIGALVSARSAAAGHGVSFEVRNLAPAVVHQLSVAGLRADDLGCRASSALQHAVPNIDPSR